MPRGAPVRGLQAVAQNYSVRPGCWEGARPERCTFHEQGRGVAFPPVETFKQGQVSSNAISMNSGWPTAEGEGHLTRGRFVGKRGKTPGSFCLLDKVRVHRSSQEVRPA